MNKYRIGMILILCFVFTMRGIDLFNGKHVASNAFMMVVELAYIHFQLWRIYTENIEQTEKEMTAHE